MRWFERYRFALAVVGLLVGAFVVQSSGEAAMLQVVWPTPNAAFMEGAEHAMYIQPTSSGRMESGLFGCVRNGGRRFHEGIDLKALQRDRRGESTDPIFAAMDGVVVYVNEVAGHSSYGRYVIIEHSEYDVPVHTLYAHLRSVSSAVRPGVRVQAGAQIGVMGRSAGGYVIPRQQAHLHFEVGLRMTDQFQVYFDRQGYGSANHHGLYNGINLMGLDPLHFYQTVRDGNFVGFAEYLRSLPVAYTVEVRTGKVPDFIRRYPGLLTRTLEGGELGGWRIDFTWYGLPKSWTPLSGDEVSLARDGQVVLTGYDPEIFEGRCRATVASKDGQAVIGSFTEDRLRLLFGSSL